MQSVGESEVAVTNAPFHVLTIGEAVDVADADNQDGGIEGLDEIKDSLCMNCGGYGTTRMLTTKIPFFREVILSSFECDVCHWKNNEVSTCSQMLHHWIVAQFRLSSTRSTLCLLSVSV